MTKKISGMTQIASENVGDDDLFELSHKKVDSTFETNSIKISELRKKMVAATDSRRIEFSGNHFLPGDHPNNTFQIQISKAFIPWHTNKDGLYISNFLAKFNISGTIIGTQFSGIEHIPLFCDFSVAYHNTIFKKYYKYIPGYYYGEKVLDTVQNYNTDPEQPNFLDGDIFTLKVVNVVETANDLFFVVSLINGFESSLQPGIHFSDSTVKFEGYVDISATYENEPSMLTLMVDPLGSVSISGFDDGTEINWGDGFSTIVSDINQTYTHHYGNVGQSTLKVIMNDFMSPTGNIIISGDFTEIVDWGSYDYAKPISFRSSKLTTVPTVQPPTNNYSSLFQNCTIFNQDLNTWNTVSATNMDRMFKGCWNFNGNISSWNTSNVIGLVETFHGCEKFNQPLNAWNVSSVTNLANTFYGCLLFNQPLNNWNVENVTNLAGTFALTSTFNQSLNDWDVSNVTNMNSTFNSSGFNGSIYDWNVSKVTNMEYMFSNNTAFTNDISNWCVLQFDSEPSGFGAPNLVSGNRPQWGACPSDTSFKYIVNTSSYPATPYTITGVPEGSLIDVGDGILQEMPLRVGGHYGFTHTPNVGEISMVKIYFNTSHAFSLPGITFKPVDSDPNVYAPITFLLDFGNYFDEQAPKFNRTRIVDMPKTLPTAIHLLDSLVENSPFFVGTNLQYWDVSNVTSMWRMFNKSTVFNGNVSNWNVSNVIDMRAMFLDASTFNRNLSTWCVAQIGSEPLQFADGATAFLSEYHPQWGEVCGALRFQVVPLVSPSTLMIHGLPVGSEVVWGDGTSSMSVSNAIPLSHTYAGSGGPETLLSGYIVFNNSNPYGTTMVSSGGIYMNGDMITGLNHFGEYQGAGFKITSSSLTVIPDKKADSIVDASGLFEGCSALTTVPTWDMSNVASTANMFKDCTSIMPYLGEWNLNNVVDMSGMFYGCTAMKFFPNFDLTFNTSLTTVAGMFDGCTSLKNFYWNMNVPSSVVDFGSMFANCTQLKSVNFVYGIDGEIENLRMMFNNCPDLTTVSGIEYWNVSTMSDIDLEGMFEDCTSFDADLSNWCVENIPSEPNQFSSNTPSWTSPKPSWGAPCGGVVGPPPVELAKPFSLSEEIVTTKKRTRKSKKVLTENEIKEKAPRKSRKKKSED